MKNYYELLEVSPNASAEVIRNAYKTLAKKYHPDVNREDDPEAAGERMKELNDAVEVLSDAMRREAYDKEQGIVRETDDAHVREIDEFLFGGEGGEAEPFEVDLADIDELPDYQTELEEIAGGAEGAELYAVKKKKEKIKIGAWYYILMTALALGCAALLFLILAPYMSGMLGDFLHRGG